MTGLRSTVADCERRVDVLSKYTQGRQNCQTTFILAKWDLSWREIDEFCFLPGDDENSHFTVADLPTNDNLVDALNVWSGQEQCVVERTFQLSKFCIVGRQKCDSRQKKTIVYHDKYTSHKVKNALANTKSTKRVLHVSIKSKKNWKQNLIINAFNPCKMT